MNLHGAAEPPNPAKTLTHFASISEQYA